MHFESGPSSPLMIEFRLLWSAFFSCNANLLSWPKSASHLVSTSQMSEFCYWSRVLFQCVRDRPTWHVGGWQRSCAGCAGAGGGASWRRRRPSDAWQVGRRVRGEGRLGLVALLALAARHTWRAHAGTQGAFCTCRQVIDGPWQVLKKRTKRED